MRLLPLEKSLPTSIGVSGMCNIARQRLQCVQPKKGADCSRATFAFLKGAH